MHTFSAIYFHIIFSTKNRQEYINPKWQEDLYKYIIGIVKKKGMNVVAIGGMPDHVHLLLRAKPDCIISDLVRDIKKASTKFAKFQLRASPDFEWQNGYSVFSVSFSALQDVANYIYNQFQHHRNYTSEEELRRYYTKFAMPFPGDEKT